MDAILPQEDRDKIAGVVVERDNRKSSAFDISFVVQTNEIKKQLVKEKILHTSLAAWTVFSIFDTLLQQIIVTAIKKENEKRVTAETISDALKDSLTYVQEDRLPHHQISTATIANGIAKRVAQQLAKDVSFSDGGLVLIGNAVGLTLAAFTEALPKQTLVHSTDLLNKAQLYIKPSIMTIINKRWPEHRGQARKIHAYHNKSQKDKVTEVVDYLGYPPVSSSVSSQIATQAAGIIKVNAAKLEQARKDKKNGRRSIKRPHAGRKASGSNHKKSKTQGL